MQSVERAKSVIVLLFDQKGRFLWQLRDFFPEISNPGEWGPFGGAIEPGESPHDAGLREVEEEIGYCPANIAHFKTYLLPGFQAHCYYGFLGADVTALKQTEGADLGVFSVEEISKGWLFSAKLQQAFPMIPHVRRIFADFIGPQPFPQVVDPHIPVEI